MMKCWPALVLTLEMAASAARAQQARPNPEEILRAKVDPCIPAYKPGQRLDPKIHQSLKDVLSRQGQQQVGREGNLSLPPRGILDQERAKLEGAP